MPKRKTIEYDIDMFKDGNPFKIVSLNKAIRNKLNIIGIDNPNYVIYQSKNVRFTDNSKIEVEVKEGDYDFSEYIKSKENIIEEKINKVNSLISSVKLAEKYVDMAKENNISVMINIIENDSINCSYPGTFSNNEFLLNESKISEKVLIMTENTLLKIKKAKEKVLEELVLLIKNLDKITNEKKVWIEVKSWSILNSGNICCKSDDWYNSKYGENYIFDREELLI